MDVDYHKVFKGWNFKNKMGPENIDGAERRNIKIDNNPDNSLSKIKNKTKNPWMIVSIVLVVIVVVLLFLVFKGGVTGNVVSADDASSKLVDYLNGMTGGGVEYVSYQDIGDLYEVTVNYQDQEIPVYVTKDGEYFVQGAVPLSGDATANTNTATQEPSAEVPKSDKPVVEAFIFSYCPYGLQFEKALFPVYDLLKNKADINIVAIGAMHGEYERVETLRQISIEQLYGRDKLFAYLKEFDVNSDIGACSGDDTCLDKYLPDLYKKLGIDKAKVEAYMDKSAQAIYDEQGSKASSLGISGSPTFVINGVEAQVSRNPESIKQAVCNAYNEPPIECDTALSTSSASAGFGSSTTSSGVTGAQC